MTAVCTGDALNEVLEASCVCALDGETPVCPEKGVCFKPAGEKSEYKCASEAVIGPKTTTEDDIGKFCENAEVSYPNVTLITGAGDCDPLGYFTPNCTKFDSVLAEDDLCICGDKKYCSDGDACFKVDETHKCYREMSTSGIALYQQYALVGAEDTPTIMKLGQYYDSKGKQIIDTCLSEFTLVSTVCNCIDFDETGEAILDNKCKVNEICVMSNVACMAFAEMNTELTETRRCGNYDCWKGEYCSNLDSTKKATDMGSFCTEKIEVGEFPEPIHGFCNVKDKKGVCFGQNTQCTEHNGCQCAKTNDGAESYGACIGEEGKACKLGQLWDGADCKDPVEPTEAQIFDKLVLTEGPIKCGETTTISIEDIEYCYDKEIYLQCLLATKTTEKCICIVGENSDRKPIALLLDVGSVCMSHYGIFCARGYEYTDDKKNNCKKIISSSDGLSVGAIVGIVVAVVVVIGIIVGVVVGLNRKKSKVETRESREDQEVAQAVQE